MDIQVLRIRLICCFIVLRYMTFEVEKTYICANQDKYKKSPNGRTACQ